MILPRKENLKNGMMLEKVNKICHIVHYMMVFYKHTFCVWESKYVFFIIIWFVCSMRDVLILDIKGSHLPMAHVFVGSF